MRAFVAPALGTFVAAILVASAVIAVSTMIRLNETRTQLTEQKRLVRIQNRQIQNLAGVALAQQDLISKQQHLLGTVVTNQQGMFTLIKRTSRRIAVR